MTTIALLDSHTVGHHLTYLQLFSQTLLQLRYRIIILTAAPDIVTLWLQENCPEYSEDYGVFLLENPSSWRINSLIPIPQPIHILRRWINTRKALKRAIQGWGETPIFCFFSYGDSYLSGYVPTPLINRVFPWSWSMLIVQPQHLKMSPKRWPLIHKPVNHYQLLNSQLCCGAATLDLLLSQDVQKYTKTLITVCPDFTDSAALPTSTPLLQTIEDRAQGRKIIGLLGALERRKGFMMLLDIARKNPHPDYFFIFVGGFADESFLPEERDVITDFFALEPEHCFFHPYRVRDEAEFNTLFKICDVIYAVYPNFPYTSNMLIKAATFQCPIIVSDRFIMGKTVDTFKLGLVVPENDPDACIEAISTLLNTADPVNIPDPEGAKRYCELNSRDQLTTCFQQLFKEVAAQ